MSNARRSTAWIAPAVLALGLLGGCATVDRSEWTGQVCGALEPVVASVRNAPPVEPANLAASQQSLSAALAGALDGLNRARAGLDQVGRSPIEGAGDVVGQLILIVGELQPTVAAAKADIDGANPGDPIPFLAILERAQRGLSAVEAGLAQARRGIESNAEMTSAAQGAPSCQRVGLAAPASTQPAPGSSQPTASTPPG